MNRRLTDSTGRVVLLLALTPVALFGQTEKGALVGTVTDTNGEQPFLPFKPFDLCVEAIDPL